MRMTKEQKGFLLKAFGDLLFAIDEKDSEIKDSFIQSAYENFEYVAGDIMIAEEEREV